MFSEMVTMPEPINSTLRDLIDDGLSGVRVHIVHYNVRTQTRVLQRICASQSGSGARDDHRLAVEADLGRTLRIALNLRRFGNLSL